jgi:hypothetical protein
MAARQQCDGSEPQRESRESLEIKQQRTKSGAVVVMVMVSPLSDVDDL